MIFPQKGKKTKVVNDLATAKQTKNLSKDPSGTLLRGSSCQQFFHHIQSPMVPRNQWTFSGRSSEQSHRTLQKGHESTRLVTEANKGVSKQLQHQTLCNYANLLEILSSPNPQTPNKTGYLMISLEMQWLPNWGNIPPTWNPTKTPKQPQKNTKNPKNTKHTPKKNSKILPPETPSLSPCGAAASKAVKPSLSRAASGCVGQRSQVVRATRSSILQQNRRGGAICWVNALGFVG